MGLTTLPDLHCSSPTFISGSLPAAAFPPGPGLPTLAFHFFVSLFGPRGNIAPTSCSFWSPVLSMRITAGPVQPRLADQPSLVRAGPAGPGRENPSNHKVSGEIGLSAPIGSRGCVGSERRFCSLSDSGLYDQSSSYFLRSSEEWIRERGEGV